MHLIRVQVLAPLAGELHIFVMAHIEVPEWDSWAADIAEFNASLDVGKSKSKDSDQGKGKDKDDGLENGKVKHEANDPGKGKVNLGNGKGKHEVVDLGTGKAKGKGKSKPIGWDGPYTDPAKGVYWIWRTYKDNTQSKTHRYYEKDLKRKGYKGK